MVVMLKEVAQAIRSSYTLQYDDRVIVSQAIADKFKRNKGFKREDFLWECGLKLRDIG